MKQMLLSLLADEKSEVQGHRGSKLLNPKAIIFSHNPEGAVVGTEATGCLFTMKFLFCC